MPFYAHSSTSNDKLTWEPLGEHLERVAHSAKARATKFGAAEFGERAGFLHDFGKIDPSFQARLSGSKAPFDHAGPGAALAMQLFGQLAGILAPIIAGHHTGLMDAVRDGETGDGAITPLEDRLKPCENELERQKTLWRDEGLKLPGPVGGLPGKPRREDKRDDQKAAITFYLAFFTRMVFSALVDADYIATEGFYEPKDRGYPKVTLSALKNQLDEFLAAKSKEAQNKHPGKLNDTRAEILAAARARAHDPQNIFTLAVPTGGGKTLASLAFALDHAAKHGLDRVIIVIPFTAVVEQTADVYREALGDLKSAILEHHSAFDDTKLRREDQAPEMGDKLRLAQENWDAPIVVTTAVQFFESLFHNKTSRCRKLHNIARSVVIIDEVQTLPLPVLKPVVLAIDELARNYKTTIVLSTATQPALLERPRKENSFAGGLRGVRPIIDNELQLFQVLKRVEIVRAESVLDDNALASRISAQAQILTIVNTRKHARELFTRIKGEEGARHLSTLMCAVHRAEVLAEIRQYLKDKRPARLVSTSLIEAGVDIDFPAVMRAEAGLDQIAQAAGRCNREGKGQVSESRVLVFETGEANSHPEMRQRWSAAKSVWRRLERGELEGTLLDPPAIEAYFRELFWQKGEDALDRYGILKLLRSYAPDGKTPPQLPMESITRKFRMIDDNAGVPIIHEWDDLARELIKGLRNPFLTKVGGIARKLQRYLISLPPRDRAKLIQRGAAEVIQPERFGEQFVVLTDQDLYRADVGLDVSDLTFAEAGHLII